MDRTDGDAPTQAGGDAPDQAAGDRACERAPAPPPETGLRESGLRGRVRALLRGWLKPILLALLIVTPFRSAVADWHDVPTGSMKPTVVEGDRVVVNELAYDLRVPLLGASLLRTGDPAPGDVVVLRSPRDGARLLKRVAAVEGQVVEMVDEVLVIDGTPLRYEELPGATHTGLPERSGLPQRQRLEHLGGRAHRVLLTPGRPAPRSFGPVQVPPGHVLVLGDNRDDSADSRAFGFVPRARLEGRVIGVAFSLDPQRFLPRWERTCIPLE
ncbi:MAG: signal peptidase I [Planctomycetota bacterium]